MGVNICGAFIRERRLFLFNGVSGRLIQSAQMSLIV